MVADAGAAAAAPGRAPRNPLSLAVRLKRVRHVSSTFGRIYLGIKTHQLIQKRLAPSDMPQRWSRLHQSSARAIYATAVELRGLILKGCQFLGSRGDVLPPEYVEALSKLQDRVPPRCFPVVRALVETELGRPLTEVFESFSEAPIAAASLAQVHEARLRSGERVAVKVQYPEIAALVRTDLASLRLLFRAVGIVERNLDLMPLFEELGTHVPKELDFVNEGRNAESISRQLSHRDDVMIPRVHWPLTTRRVLVMEFVEGIKINQADALHEAGVDTNRLMRTLIEVYCEQILTRGHFHADPHPGNLLVQPDALGPGTGPRLVFVDFGLTKQLPPDFRAAVVAFAAALLGGKADQMAQALAQLGFETREASTASLEAIAEVLLDVATKLRNQSFVDPELLRKAGQTLSGLIRENPIVRIPTHMVLLGRVLGLLSGLGRSLDARVDMLQAILPYALGTAGAPQPATAAERHDLPNEVTAASGTGAKPAK